MQQYRFEWILSYILFVDINDIEPLLVLFQNEKSFFKKKKKKVSFMKN